MATPSTPTTAATATTTTTTAGSDPGETVTHIQMAGLTVLMIKTKDQVIYKLPDNMSVQSLSQDQRERLLAEINLLHHQQTTAQVIAASQAQTQQVQMAQAQAQAQAQIQTLAQMQGVRPIAPLGSTNGSPGVSSASTPVSSGSHRSSPSAPSTPTSSAGPDGQPQKTTRRYNKTGKYSKKKLMQQQLLEQQQQQQQQQQQGQQDSNKAGRTGIMANGHPYQKPQASFQGQFPLANQQLLQQQQQRLQAAAAASAAAAAAAAAAAVTSSSGASSGPGTVSPAAAVAAAAARMAGLVSTSQSGTGTGTPTSSGPKTVEEQLQQQIAEHHDSVRTGMAMELQATHRNLRRPDYRTPFSSLQDAIERLLPFHVFQYPTQDIDAQARAFNNRSEVELNARALLIHRRKDALYTKYNRLIKTIATKSTATNSSSGLDILALRLGLDDEREEHKRVSDQKEVVQSQAKALREQLELHQVQLLQQRKAEAAMIEQQQRLMLERLRQEEQEKQQMMAQIRQMQELQQQQQLQEQQQQHQQQQQQEMQTQQGVKLTEEEEEQKRREIERKELERQHQLELEKQMRFKQELLQEEEAARRASAASSSSSTPAPNTPSAS